MTEAVPTFLVSTRVYFRSAFDLPSPLNSPPAVVSLMPPIRSMLFPYSPFPLMSSLGLTFVFCLLSPDVFFLFRCRYFSPGTPAHPSLCTVSRVQYLPTAVFVYTGTLCCGSCTGTCFLSPHGRRRVTSLSASKVRSFVAALCHCPKVFLVRLLGFGGPF